MPNREFLHPHLVDDGAMSAESSQRECPLCGSGMEARPSVKYRQAWVCSCSDLRHYEGLPACAWHNCQDPVDYTVSYKKVRFKEDNVEGERQLCRFHTKEFSGKQNVTVREKTEL